MKYLRSHHDSDVLKASFGEDTRVVIIGAGWIGLEAAAAARAAGSTVTVVEMAELPLVGVLGPEMAEVFAKLHRDNGVDLRLGAKLKEIELDRDGKVVGVILDDGTIDADVVLAGVGVAPEDSLARSAELDVDNGVLVDRVAADERPGHLRGRRRRQPRSPGAQAAGSRRALGQCAQPAGHRSGGAARRLVGAV